MQILKTKYDLNRITQNVGEMVEMSEIMKCPRIFHFVLNKGNDVTYYSIAYDNDIHFHFFTLSGLPSLVCLPVIVRIVKSFLFVLFWQGWKSVG